jgi:SAM-dependent methyltransferase
MVYCVGVLHHLPDPAQGFRVLARRLAPGGRIHVWVYGWEGNGWIRCFFDPVRRHIFRRLPPVLIRPLAGLAALPLHLLSKVYALAGRILPTVHKRLFYRDYLTFLADLPFRNVFWIVFDQMVAPTTHYIRRHEVEAWLREAGLEQTGVESLRGMSWRGWGRAPAGA